MPRSSNPSQFVRVRRHRHKRHPRPPRRRGSQKRTDQHPPRPHLNAFLDELTAFPHGRHDDCIDALSGAHRELSRTHGTATGTTHVPRGRIPTRLTQHRRLRSPHDPIAELAAQVGAHLHSR